MKFFRMQPQTFLIVLLLLAYGGCSSSNDSQASAERKPPVKTDRTIIRETLASFVTLADEAKNAECPQPPKGTPTEDMETRYRSTAPELMNTVVLSEKDVEKIKQIVVKNWAADLSYQPPGESRTLTGEFWEYNFLIDNAIEVGQDDSHMHKPFYDSSEMVRMVQNIKYVAIVRDYRIKQAPTIHRNVKNPIPGLLTPGQRRMNNIPDLQFKSGIAEADVVVLEASSGKVLGAFVVQAENRNEQAFVPAQENAKLTHDQQYERQLQVDLHHQMLNAVLPRAIEYFAQVETE